MGYHKNKQIEQDEHERECPECGGTVWVKWGDSPNFHCKECDIETDVKQCENCSNLLYENDEEYICSDCIAHAMRD
ncbi:hypothetical protein [Paenibacillus sp. NPDC101420]|uniref:hypothetical protein n=1 Tax=Paenibacillus sp. NPDC101420 TaxID=3390602 RepID=UPI003D06A3F8